MTKTGVNNKLLKQKNRGLLLKLIATGECSSRIELAQKTGLAKMTVSNIVSEFIESGILEERKNCRQIPRDGIRYSFPLRKEHPNCWVFMFTEKNTA